MRNVIVKTVKGALTLASESYHVWTRRGFNNYAGRTPVMYCHHATGGSYSPYRPWAPSSNAPVTDASLADIVEELASAGHPVIAGDLVAPQAWYQTGTNSVDDMCTQLLAQVAAETGCRSDRVLLLGDSMGSFTSLNWSRRAAGRGVTVAAMALLLPIPSISYLHDNDILGVWKATLETAYGSLAAFNTAVPLYDCFQQNPRSWDGLPMRFWAADDDTVGSAVQVQQFLNFAGRRDVQLTYMGYVGHTIPASQNPLEVANYLMSYA